MTESIIGREVLIKLMSEPGFVNALFLNSGMGSRVDTTVVDAFLRVAHSEGKLLDLLNWAVDAEFESLGKSSINIFIYLSLLIIHQSRQSNSSTSFTRFWRPVKMFKAMICCSTITESLLRSFCGSSCWFAVNTCKNCCRTFLPISWSTRSHWRWVQEWHFDTCQTSSSY